jgi:putative membrane protein
MSLLRSRSARRLRRVAFRVAHPRACGRFPRAGDLVRLLSTAAAALVASAPALSFAHPGEAMAPHDLWTTWSFDPVVVVPMALSALLYGRGVARLRGAGAAEYAAGAWRVRWFVAGWLSLFVALITPLDPLGGVLFSAHMAQHELLMVVAAPLLVLGRPLVPFIWGLPGGWARKGAVVLRSATARQGWAFITTPFVAWALHGVALWLWHIPALFEATLESDLVHAVQHASFLGTALLFCWALFEHHSGRRGHGVAVLYVFTTAVHSSILGALLTFAPTVWYPSYAATTAAWGLTPLEDQQLGGLIMWVPAGTGYVVVALVLFVSWMHGTDLRAGRPVLGFEPAARRVPR